MFRDTRGNLHRPYKNVSGKPGLVSGAASCAAPVGLFLWVGVHEPLGCGGQVLPISGISHPLLAVVASARCTALPVTSGRLKWARITAIPLTGVPQ